MSGKGGGLEKGGLWGSDRVQHDSLAVIDIELLALIKAHGTLFTKETLM